MFNTSETHPRPSQKPSLEPGRSSDSLAFLFVSLAFIALYWITTQDATGDTPFYVSDIISHSSDTAHTRRLWEFGHLLWRPLGYLLWHLTTPLTALFFGDNTLLQAQFGLFAMNFAGGLSIALLAFAIARRFGLERSLAYAVSAGSILSSAVLNYMHSGTSYIPGLACYLAALLFIIKAIQEESNRLLFAILSGAALALACLLWFPYILGVPAALLVWLCLALPAGQIYVNASLRKRIELLLAAAITAGALILIAYFAVAAICHISSLAEFQEWMHGSEHGMRADRPFIRFPTGIARTFFFVGDAGLLLKRFIFGDPYVQVRVIDLLSGLWKVALAFLMLLALIWSLVRNRANWPVLAVLAAAALPTIAFAFRFDTSSPERYLPVAGALVLAVCAVLARELDRRMAHLVLGVFLVAMVLVNLKAYTFDLRSAEAESVSRAAIVHQHTQHGGVALTLSPSDPLGAYFQRRAFDPANRPNALSVYPIFNFAFLGSTPWSQAMACRILKSWNEGGEVWLSKRLLASQPQADWIWVESDHPNTRWSDIAPFIGRLNTDADLGGADGFLRIAKNSPNEIFLEETCADPKAQ
jgi:hypothetical protein